MISGRGVRARYFYYSVLRVLWWSNERGKSEVETGVREITIGLCEIDSNKLRFAEGALFLEEGDGLIK